MRAFVTALALFAACAAQAQPACEPPTDFPNPALLSAMKRGVNLPGWDHEDAAQRPTLAQLSATRAAGLTHIRLPIDEQPLRGVEAKAYLDRLYEQVVFLVSLDFAVSLDLHAGGEIGRRFGADVEGALGVLSPMWRELAQVARRFDPSKVAVELLNEPEFPQDAWMAIAERLRAQVRSDLPDHTIVIGPSGPQRHETLSGMQPFGDRNVVYAVHYYDPFPFTHQGANWGGPGDPLRHFAGLPFPATKDSPEIGDNLARLNRAGMTQAADLLRRTTEEPWDGAMIAGAYDMMAAWAGENDAPVIVNEFGVLSFEAPRASRLRWLADTAKAAADRCIGWTHWDFQDGFGLVDPATGMPDPQILDALSGRGGQAGR